MNDARDPSTDDADEDATMRLLRLAGSRSPVPATRAARVRGAVHAQWQIRSRQRAMRRRIVSASVLLATAALVLTIGRFTLVDRRAAPFGEVVAVVEEIEGVPRRATDSSDGPAVTSVSRNDRIRTGDWIETDAGARVALRFSDGTSVRLDVDSRARPHSSSVLDVSTGAVYVDTGRESGHFEVRTAVATARDLGTQFEVRLLDRTVRLRVRTGVVELNDGARSVSARGGTEITLSNSAAVSRPIAAHGPAWEWTARVSPPLDIEGVALSIFLERIAREHGWALHYADPALAQDASGVILHGSVNGLTPNEAVEVAIATSGLRHRLESGELVVLRGRDRR